MLQTAYWWYTNKWWISLNYHKNRNCPYCVSAQIKQTRNKWLFRSTGWCTLELWKARLKLSWSSSNENRQETDIDLLTKLSCQQIISKSNIKYLMCILFWYIDPYLDEGESFVCLPSSRPTGSCSKAVRLSCSWRPKRRTTRTTARTAAREPTGFVLTYFHLCVCFRRSGSSSVSLSPFVCPRRVPSFKLSE